MSVLVPGQGPSVCRLRRCRASRVPALAPPGSSLGAGWGPCRWHSSPWELSLPFLGPLSAAQPCGHLACNRLKVVSPLWWSQRPRHAGGSARCGSRSRSCQCPCSRTVCPRPGCGQDPLVPGPTGGLHGRPSEPVRVKPGLDSSPATAVVACTVDFSVPRFPYLLSEADLSYFSVKSKRTEPKPGRCAALSQLLGFVPLGLFSPWLLLSFAGTVWLKRCYLDIGGEASHK